MGSNRRKKQHYIPQMLLKNFCDEDGCLWVGDKKTREVRKSIPKNECTFSDLYTKVDPETDEKNYKYEEILAEFENKFAPILKDAIDQIRNKRRYPDLSPEHLKEFKKFIWQMHMRTPESQHRLLNRKSFKKTFGKRIETRVPPSAQPIFKSVCFERLKNKSRHPEIFPELAGQLATVTDPKAEEERHRKSDLVFILIDIPKGGFVIGSHGVGILKLADEIEETFLPITHDICVFEERKGTRQLLLVDAEDPDIKYLNQLSVRLSNQIFGRSERLIRSLLSNRAS